MKTIVHVYGAARSTLALIGVAALSVALLLPLQRDSLVRHVAGAADFLSAAMVAEAPFQVALSESTREHEQRALAEFIAKRYRVAETAAASFVAIAYRAGVEYSVDPMLILAVMAIESRYNPVAESGVGAKILREYLRRFGDAETALQQYNGALDEATSRYSTKVFAEKARLDLLRQKARKPQSA